MLRFRMGNIVAQQMTQFAVKIKPANFELKASLQPIALLPKTILHVLQSARLHIQYISISQIHDRLVMDFGAVHTN